MRSKCEKRWVVGFFELCGAAELIIARLAIFILFFVGLLKLIGC
jgi:hypothetical protein